MTVQSIRLENADDLTIESITPQKELQAVNHLLDDPDALAEFQLENGYIFLRGVVDADSIIEARDSMQDILLEHGVITEKSERPVATGKPFGRGMEEHPMWSGIAPRLVNHPSNQKLMSQILGEPATMVPIVQYRAYPPGTVPTGVHQDGFFSPGIINYKPVWMPLVHTDRALGGLMLAVGENKRGYFHNLAKPPMCPVPEGVIDPDSWATTEYEPGDVLVIHPYTPHASMPNTTNRIRMSIDTRIQSAKDPRILAGAVTDFGADFVTLDTGEGGERRFEVNEETFIRIIPDSQSERVAFDQFEATVRKDSRLVAVFSGARAVMLRCAAEG